MTATRSGGKRPSSRGARKPSKTGPAGTRTRTASNRSGHESTGGRAAPTDRFRARRLAAQRSAGMKRLRIVLGLTLVSTVAIGVIGFINSSAFDVDEIVVVGNDRADPHLIVDASGITIGQALLEVDLDTAVDRIQLVPWVGTASVTRAWSGSIEIAITERGPSAALRAGDGYALVDDHGRQLELVDERPQGFMPVSGIEGSGVAGEPAPPEAMPVIALLDALPPEVERQIDAVAFENGELFLELAAGGRANFGDGSDLGPKLQSLETMLAGVDLTCLNTIDVRVPAAPVLTRTDQSTGPTDSVAGQTTEGEPNEEPDSAGSDC